jgi:hypothetical protein
LYLNLKIIENREFYLDGNELGCRGALAIIKNITQLAESEAIRLQIEARAAFEEKQKQLEEGFIYYFILHSDYKD